MLPDYNFLSAPLWLVTLLHIATLTLHLIAMNFLFGGLIIILFGRFDDKWNHPVVLKFIKLFPNAMAATVSFGVAPLLFVQLVYHKQIYAASIVSGWFWLMIIASVIISYYCLYASSFTKKRAEGKRIYLVLALSGMFYVSFVYSSVFSLAEQPDLYQQLYAGNQTGTVLNPNMASYVFRWLHMVFGAVTVGGFFVGWLGKDDERTFAVSKKFVVWGMLASFLTGLVYMLGLGDLIRPFMRSPGIWLVTAGFLLSLGSLYFIFKRKFTFGGIALLISLVCMVMTRHVVRLLHLGGYFEPATLPTLPQWSVFMIFLFLFVLMIGTLIFMFWLFFGKQE